MLKKLTALGLALIVISGSLFEWTRRQPPPLHQLFPEAANIETGSEAFPVGAPVNYRNLDQLLAGLRNKPQDEIEKEQKARLMAKMEQLASSKETPEPILAETLYGPQWQAEVTRYKRLMAQQELAAIASIALGIVGLVTMILTTLFASVRLTKAIGGSISARQKRKKAAVASDEEAPDTQPAYKAEAWPLEESSKQPPPKIEPKLSQLPSNFATIERSESLTFQRDAYCSPRLGSHNDPEEEQKFDLFLTDEDSVHTHTAIHVGDQSWLHKSGLGSETAATSSLEKRTDDVARQITQVQQLVTENMQQTSSIAEPFGETLHQLNDQISAIRQYASSQQDRVEKLQNGYDWNIIRTFCLRIIRCIDNLDVRIERCADEPASNEMLHDIRDELLFSLESSGVEQFDLERDSVFSGQERLAEAIKEKENSDSPELKGRIAQVVKPGYQYVLDDENVKIVRTARVKLYG